MAHAQKTTHPIHIFVDDREAKCGTVQVFSEMAGVNITVKRLPLGDYEIDGKMLFERKTLLDLIASIKDGRLFRQACRLASAPTKSAIILEGTSRDIAETHMRREAIQGALITLTVILGIPLLRSKDAVESAHLMLYTARQLRSNDNSALPRRVKRPKGKRKLQLHLLQGLPGVGPERALRLLETCGSVEAVFTASVGTLVSITGIGEHTAKLIRWAVSKDTNHL